VRSALVLLGLALATSAAGAEPPALPYLGARPPGRIPEIFAPGVVSTGLGARDITFTPDGRALYVGIFMPGFTRAVILESRREGGRWTPLEVAPFSRDPRWRHMEPCVSPDGETFFFVSDRPADPARERPDRFAIWTMRRDGRGWGNPVRLPAAVNGDANAFYPSVTRDGVLHFLREEGRGGWIMRSAFRDGAWSEAERLPPPFNASPDQANPRVDPDGRFVLVPLLGRPDSLGGADYYGYFRRDDGTWTEAVHLGPVVNSPARDEFSISLGPDGKVLFFGSDRTLPRLDGRPLRWKDLLAERTLPGNGTTSIWWVDASVLEEARARALGPERPAAR
jgi:hypothetical protein